jgi:galactokinase
MVEKESEMHFALVPRLFMDQAAAARGVPSKVLAAQMLETATEQARWVDLELMV